MCTTHALTVSHSMLAGGGGCLPLGGVWWGVSAPGGSPPGGCLLGGRVSALGGVSSGGVSDPRGGVCSLGV